MRPMLTAGLVALALAPIPYVAQAETATKPTSAVPEGLWVLNLKRSQALLGKAPQTLWVVKDDGEHFTFILVERPASGPVIAAWNGRRDGVPRPVQGRDFQMAVSSAGDAFRIDGTMPEGRFSETCGVEQRTRLVCRGTLTMGDKSSSYVDDYDWFGPAPD